jgi:hypothetical protein
MRTSANNFTKKNVTAYLHLGGAVASAPDARVFRFVQSRARGPRQRTMRDDAVGSSCVNQKTFAGDVISGNKKKQSAGVGRMRAGTMPTG